jgi:hypothetical protein
LLTDEEIGLAADRRLKWVMLQPERPFASQPYFQLAKVLRQAGDDQDWGKVLAAMESRLANQSSTQPYLDLAKVLREAGDDSGSRRVLIAMEDRRWKGTIWGPFLRWTIGYGYNPLGAFWEVLGLSALGWIIYRRGYLAGNLVPTSKDAYESFKSDGESPSCHSPFSPLINLLD